MDPESMRELIAAKQGYIIARENDDRWFAVVNSCPYGPAVPGNGNVLAHAWYYGFWFWFYTMKPWKEAARGKQA